MPTVNSSFDMSKTSLYFKSLHQVGVWTFAILLLRFLSWFEYWLSIGLDTMVAIVGAVAMMILTGFAGQVSLGHAAFIGVGAYSVAI